MFYNSDKHDYWYYARELQNGVINLKLPKEIFQSRAAKLTNFPDENYKSGYLWKTLFPAGWGEDEIVNVIRVALDNIDHEMSTNGELVGYAFKEEALKEMRVCILHRDGKINSVYPSWTQPCTGNNGKPYSHFDSIGHVISESTLYFDSESKLKLTIDTKLLGEDFMLNNLPSFTPEFILNREFVGDCDIDLWSNKKNFKLMEYAGGYHEHDILSIKSYLLDSLIVKNNIIEPRYIYDNHYFEMVFSKVVFNSFQMHQNIIDCLIVIGFYDTFNKTNHTHDVIYYLLKNMVTHTGGLDSWNKKRILNTMIEVVLLHHDVNLMCSFIRWLVDSPWKRELFIDINCATFDKLDLNPSNVFRSDGVFDYSLISIHVTEQPIKCKINHFMYYYILNLGETYLSLFDLDWLERLFNDKHSFNLKSLISDSIKYTRSKDLSLFSEQFDRIVEHVISNKVKGLDELDILSIFKDYYRIQSAQRLRVNLYYKDVSSLELNYGDPENVEFIRGTCLKHERECNEFSINLFFESCEKIGQFMKSPKIIQEVNKQRELYFKSIPPLPDRNHLKLKGCVST
jgi:hypothetical protein